MIIQKPTNIYEPTTTTTTTKKPNKTSSSFNYEKPEGWNKKPSTLRFSFFTRLKKGLFDEEMDPSDQRKYDSFLFEFKVASITFVIVMVVCIAVFSGPWITSKYNGEDYSPTYLDQAIDFFSDEYDQFMNDPVKSTIPIVDTVMLPIEEDTSVIIEEMSPAYLDSFINKYKEDSIRIADSLNALE